MAWLRKKADPFSDRARVLNSEIASLEAQIKKLDERLQRQQHHQSRPRPTASSSGAAASSTASTALAPAAPTTVLPQKVEPIFEPVDLNRLQPTAEGPGTAEHFNELGVRKYDLPALVRRLKGHFQGPSTTNPKLVSYLAAGGIQGLRPLRYEKRVARNRFIVLVGFLLVVLIGLLLVFSKK